MVTGIYILFKSKYEFPNIPEGFIVEELGEKTSLSHTINYFNASGNYKNRTEFEQEKEKYCKIITEWAMNLPERER